MYTLYVQTVGFIISKNSLFVFFLALQPSVVVFSQPGSGLQLPRF